MFDPADSVFANPPAKLDHAAIWHGQVELNAKIVHLLDLVGRPPEPDGTGAKGLCAEVYILKARLQTYDQLKQRAVGMLMAGSMFIAAFWWMTRDKWSHFLGVGS